MPHEFLSFEEQGDKELKKGNCEQAIKEFSQAITLDPKNPRFYIKRGQAVMDSGRVCPEDDYNKVIKLAPNSVEGYYALSLMSIRKGAEKEEVFSYLDKAISLAPDWDLIYELRASYKRTILKDFTGALKDYDKAIELNPDYYLYYYYRACTKYDLKDYIGAIQDSTTALNFFPKFAEAYQQMGKAKKKMGDKLGAKEDLKKAKKLGAIDNSAFSFYRFFSLFGLMLIVFIVQFFIGNGLPFIDLSVPEETKNVIIYFAFLIIPLIFLFIAK